MKPAKPEMHEDKDSFARFRDLAKKVFTAKKDEPKNPPKTKKKQDQQKPAK